LARPSRAFNARIRVRLFRTSGRTNRCESPTGAGLLKLCGMHSAGRSCFA
jgi:hypothetical protein